MKKEISNYEIMSYTLGFEAGKMLGDIIQKLPQDEQDKIKTRLFEKLRDVINNTDMSSIVKMIASNKPFEFQDEVLDIYNKHINK